MNILSSNSVPLRRICSFASACAIAILLAGCQSTGSDNLVASTAPPGISGPAARSEEHTSELQSLMRISYAVFCLKKKKITQHNTHHIYKCHQRIQQNNTKRTTKI